MQVQFDELNPVEQMQVLQALAQPALIKLLHNVLTAGVNQRANMVLPSVADTAKCQQFVSDCARSNARSETVQELMDLLSTNLKRMNQEN